VLIPAGLSTDPDFDAQEDWVGAVAIAMRMDGAIGHGADLFAQWRRRILDEGIDALFHSAPHSAKLRRVGLDDDISYCAQLDITQAVPCAIGREGAGVWVVNANAAREVGNAG